MVDDEMHRNSEVVLCVSTDIPSTDLSNIQQNNSGITAQRCSGLHSIYVFTFQINKQ